MNEIKKRRSFLKNSFFTFLSISAVGQLLNSNSRNGLKANTLNNTLNFNNFTIQDINQENEKFVLPKLKYGYDALEPHIDALTMQIHYGKHHQAYIDNLNKAKLNSKFDKMSLLEIHTSLTGEKSENAIRNNAGGHFNHTFFWNILTPNQKSKSPNGKLATAINNSYGSFEKFKTEFENEAKSRFGSGWAWLIIDSKTNKLKIVSTPNQDNTLMAFNENQGQPILGLDVWEHAYYLKYQNKRADYISAFWNVIDWDLVCLDFEKL